MRSSRAMHCCTSTPLCAASSAHHRCVDVSSHSNASSTTALQHHRTAALQHSSPGSPTAQQYTLHDHIAPISCAHYARSALRRSAFTRRTAHPSRSITRSRGRAFAQRRRPPSSPPAIHRRDNRFARPHDSAPCTRTRAPPAAQQHRTSAAPQLHREHISLNSARQQRLQHSSVGALIPRAGHSSRSISLGAQLRSTAQHTQCAFQQHCSRLSAIARSSARARSTLALAFACTARTL